MSEVKPVVSDFEKRLNRKLASDDFDDIAEAITPKNLGQCAKNALLKAFEVSGYLRFQARQDRPDVEEIDKLANSVEEFTTSLIDPLKSDTREREAFGDTLDLILDKAIEHNQEKFLSHPVVYNLLDKIWRGRFAGWKSKWPMKWMLLKFYCLFDIFLFPFLFAVLFVFHNINKWRRKRRELDLCFILNATGKGGKEDLSKMIDCIKYIINQIGVSSTNYCVVSLKRGKSFQYIKFDNSESTYINDQEGRGRLVFKNVRGNLIRKLDALNPPLNSCPALHDDFQQAEEAFKSDAVRITSKKVVIVFSNDSTGSFGPQKGKLRHHANNLTETIGAKIVPVAIGDRPVVDDLERIASENKVFRTQLEDHAKLGRMLLREVYEEDIYEKYLDFFTTPYFVFVRDTLSYLFLLGLHMSICLSPATISFSATEWVILVFFIGRFLSEIKQYNARVALKRGRKYSIKQRRYDYHQQSSDSQDENIELVVEVEGNFRSRKIFSSLGKYFSDRWNVLDFIMLVIYVVTFLLRMVTWGVSNSIPGNKALVIAGYFYGLNTMILTLRVFGHLMETSKATGTTHIALISIIVDVAIIFIQFTVGVLAFSLAITKIYVAEGSYISTGERLLKNKNGSNLDCHFNGLSCWYNIMKHLVWTLLGITELDIFSTTESASDFLGTILYGIFIIVALVLLVNMMIAVLSHTYERVQNNSLRAWSFKRAVTIRTYRDYHPIPVPFNLLSQFFLALRRRSNHHTELNHKKMERKVQALDHMIEKLKVIYFAKYGFSFPLSDEDKMNGMFAETSRNREMCNQIIRRVFTDSIQSNHSLPDGPLAWKSAGIHIEDHLLTYLGPEHCSRCSISRKDFHGARYKLPFSNKLPKFEVIIQEDGMKRDIVIGVVRAKHDVHFAAGEIRHTVGYHACNGHIVYCDGFKKQLLMKEGPVVYRGDLIGCWADFDEASYDQIPIHFTLNGHKVAQVSISMGADKSDLFPFVGMKHNGIRVLAKICPANEKRSQDKRESLENGHEALSSMFSEMQQAKVLYNTLESVGEVKESSDVILQHLKESSEKISDGMRIHEENMKKIESAVEAQNQRIEELHKALNQILNIVAEKAEKEP